VVEDLSWCGVPAALEGAVDRQAADPEQVGDLGCAVLPGGDQADQMSFLPCVLGPRPKRGGLRVLLGRRRVVLIGVRADGRKELITLADGYRESEGSWADLLRDAKRRGMRAPVLAVGDGVLGFWAALGEVLPETRAQRCWFHKTANMLSALPKSARSGARKALAEIWNAGDKEHARAAVRAFDELYGAKWPRAIVKITDDGEELLAFYDYPAEHWIHLRTTELIESTFATSGIGPRSPRGSAPRPPGSPWHSS
jgi:hypothetical protein